MKTIIGLFSFASLLVSCAFKDNSESNASPNPWKHDSTTHFKLHAQQGVSSANNLHVIGKQVEKIQGELLSILQEKQPQVLELYFLKDRQTLTAYTGFPANAYTVTDKGIIYFVDSSEFHLAYRHEIMHALSLRLWGPPKGYWLSEGIAVFASGNCAGYDLHALAHEISQQDKLVQMNTLIDTFDFRKTEPSLQAASFVKYISENHGIHALKGFWQHGLRNTSELIGISSSDLESRWKKFIDQDKFEADINWTIIKRHGCE